MPHPSRVAACAVAALSAVSLGVALRAMAPFSPWWGDAPVYAYFAVAACWGVRAVARHPAATPRAQWTSGAALPGAFGVLVLVLGGASLASARTEMGGLLAFAILCLGALVTAVGAGAVALGCVAGRAVADHDAPDALDQLAARAAPPLGLLGAAAATFGLDVARGVGVLAWGVVLGSALAVWRRDGARAAWITRVRDGSVPSWRWRDAETPEALRWVCADDAPRAYEVVEDAPPLAGEGPFREAPRAAARRWGVSGQVVARLRGRRRRLAVSAAATTAALALGAWRSYTNHQRAFPSGTDAPVSTALAEGPVVAATGTTARCASRTPEGRSPAVATTPTASRGTPTAGGR